MFSEKDIHLVRTIENSLCAAGLVVGGGLVVAGANYFLGNHPNYLQDYMGPVLSVRNSAWMYGAVMAIPPAIVAPRLVKSLRALSEKVAPNKKPNVSAFFSAAAIEVGAGVTFTLTAVAVIESGLSALSGGWLGGLGYLAGASIPMFGGIALRDWADFKVSDALNTMGWEQPKPPLPPSSTPKDPLDFDGPGPG